MVPAEFDGPAGATPVPPALDYASPLNDPSRGRQLLAAAVLVLWSLVDFFGGIWLALGGIMAASLGASDLAMPFLVLIPLLLGILLFAWSFYTVSFAVGLIRSTYGTAALAMAACRQAEVFCYVLAPLLLLPPLLVGALSQRNDALYALIPIGMVEAVVLPSVTLTRLLLRSLVPPADRTERRPDIRSPSSAT